MIKNIIFDVGMVLVDFNWKRVMEELGFSPEEVELVAAATVGSATWNEYDRSKISDEAVLEGFISNAPGLEKQICLFWQHVADTITCYPYTHQWIGEMKERGYRCYILSNYARRTYEITKEALSFETLMDGVLYSYQVQQVKPEPEIFQSLFDKFQLKPQECVFFDDNTKNIQGAKEMGIHGILFQNKDQAQSEFEALVKE